MQVFVDEKGNKASVLLAYAEWEKLTAKVNRLEKKLKVFADVRDGVREIKQAA